jgi:hypothetical protein
LHLSITFILKQKFRFMSKNKKGYDLEDFQHVTPQMIAHVESVLADKQIGRYSVSNVYKAHNGVFKLREAQQTCPSCLVTRTNALAKWLDWFKGTQPVAQEIAGTTQAQINAVNEATTIDEVVAKYLFAGTDTPEGARATFSTALETGVPALTDNERAVVTAYLSSLAPAPVMPLTNEENETLFKYLGLTDESTVEQYRDAIVAFMADPTQTIAGDMRGRLQSKVEAMNAELAKEPADIVPPVEGSENIAPNTDGYVTLAEGAQRIILQRVNKDTYVAEGDALYGDFTPNADDATKGIVTNSITGKALAGGTYATEDTTKLLSVQPGGKASYKTIA